jgi:hypothetical protein
MRVFLSTTGSCGDVERWWDSRRGGAGVRSSGLRGAAGRRWCAGAGRPPVRPMVTGATPQSPRRAAAQFNKVAAAAEGVKR